MAGNALPLVLLAGAAFFLTRKKGGSKTSDTVIPEGQGQGATPKPDETQDESPDEPAEGGAFDATAQMPWIETIEDYQAWTQALEAGEENRLWTGALEFRDMNDQHAEVGIFIEEQLNAYGRTYGRTVDRSELDPEVKEAMLASELAMVEKAIDEVFETFTGLDFLLVFLNDSLPVSLAIMLVFDSAASQGASMTKMAEFDQKWNDLGVDVLIKAGFMGMTGPELPDAIAAFLESFLPKNYVTPGLTPGLVTESNP